MRCRRGRMMVASPLRSPPGAPKPTGCHPERSGAISRQLRGRRGLALKSCPSSPQPLSRTRGEKKLVFFKVKLSEKQKLFF